MKMLAKVYKVEFMEVGKIYNFTFDGQLKRGDKVLGMSFFGLEVGTVIGGPIEVDVNETDYDLKPILRPLSGEDFEKHEKNMKDAQEAYEICLEKIDKLKLPMKLLKAVYMFDRSKLLFYFSAEGRVDFRELVKELARTFKTRIELRQVGVRDEMKFIGGLGLCGQPVCCRRFLRDFDKITLKDAKKQQLMINPAKISGQCRRLLCCLRYEVDNYEDMMKGIPGQGSIVQYKGEVCKVINSNVFSKTVTAQTDSGQTYSIPFEHFYEDQNSVISNAESSDDDNVEMLPDEED